MEYIGKSYTFRVYEITNYEMWNNLSKKSSLYYDESPTFLFLTNIGNLSPRGLGQSDQNTLNRCLQELLAYVIIVISRKIGYFRF
jgi:hypothetical protein